MSYNKKTILVGCNAFVIVWLLLLHVSVKCQGVTFLDDLDWSQVIQKAKVEGKNIFVDCFTTWCKPCKEMDRKVYASAEVANSLSGNFICVKVQMDSTKSDNSAVRMLYPFARKIEKEGLVSVYPTYLFYSSTGVLMNKGIGFMSVDRFLNLAKESLSPKTQYYSQLEQLDKKVQFDDSLYQWMLAKAIVLKDTGGSRIIARRYIDYLERIAKNRHIYNGSVIRQVAYYIGSGDKNLFSVLYRESNRLDTVFHDTAYCKAIVGNIIEREEIMKYLVKNGSYSMPLKQHPDWERIRMRIADKYNTDYAERAVLTAKRRWYKISRPNWNELAKAHFVYIEKYMDIKSGNKVQLWGVNNILWNDVFLNVSDRDILLKAANIQMDVVKQRPNDDAYLDTYANLLYRAGDRGKALEWEEKAVASNINNKDNVANLEKMKQGIPTWISK